MAEILNWPSICTVYDSEWVVIENPQFDDQMELKQGKVLCHSGEKHDVVAYAKGLPRPIEIAIMFTGRPVPEGTAAILGVVPK